MLVTRIEVWCDGDDCPDHEDPPRGYDAVEARQEARKVGYVTRIEWEARGRDPAVRKKHDYCPDHAPALGNPNAGPNAVGGRDAIR